MPDQTPVTDEDRDALDLANMIEKNPHSYSDTYRGAARAIRAHVPAPPATLADELRAVPNEYGMSPTFAGRMESLADRVEDVEKDNERLSRDREDQEKALVEHGRLLSEARAEVERRKFSMRKLREDQEEAWGEVDSLRDQLKEAECEREAAFDLMREKDTRISNQRQELARLNTKVASLTELYSQAEATLVDVASERDKARSEVERLSDELDKAKHGDWLKEALPDPADVPKGELWLIRAHGWNGLRVGARTDADERPAEPWHWMFADQNGHGVCGDDHVTLVSRLAPDVRRVIDRPEVLDKLPVGSIVLEGDREAWQRKEDMWWHGTGGTSFAPTSLHVQESLPVTVIHEGVTA